MKQLPKKMIVTKTKTMTDYCDVDGCDNDANTICETKDDNGKVIVEKAFCKEHIKSFIFGEIDE